MRHLFCTCLFLFTVLGQSLLGTIVEIKHFAELKAYLEPHTLVILDIDDTLITPKQMLGSDPWFRMRIQEHAKTLPKARALEWALKEWKAVQFATEVQAVEESIPSMIHHLQQKGHLVMGLSTRDTGMDSITTLQLNSVGIDLSRTSPVKESVTFHNGRPCKFYRGVLFTSATHKGRALESLLQHLSIQPEHIVFVNDKKKNIRPVEETYAKKQTRFVGLRYGFLDERKKAFKPEVAQRQHANFLKIMSDDEAEEELHHLTQKPQVQEFEGPSPKPSSLLVGALQ